MKAWETLWLEKIQVSHVQVFLAANLLLRWVDWLLNGFGKKISLKCLQARKLLLLFVWGLWLRVSNEETKEK
jgi:hypothetical protein